MTPFIFYYAFSSFLSGLLILAIGVYVLSKASEPLDRFYFLLALDLFVIAICEAFLRSAPNLAVVNFWAKPWILAWAIGFALFLHYAAVFSRVKFRFIPLFYLGSIIIFILRGFTPYFIAGFEKKYFGYVYLPGGWEWLYTLFYSSCLMGGLYLIYRVYRGAKEYYRRKQAELILYSSVVPITIGILFDVVFNYFRTPFFPLAIITSALMIGFAGYAILRYQIISETSKEQVAEGVARALLDVMFLTDNEEKINYTNLAACRLTGYCADELLGMDIKKIFPKIEELTTSLHKKDGTLVSVSLSVFRISSKQGYIYFARDLTPIFRLRKSTLKMNAEFERLIAREHQVMQMLFKLSGQIEMEKIEELCDGLEKDDLEVQAILSPVCEVMKEYVKVLDETRRSREGLLMRTQELEELNHFMAGREKILIELESESERLKV